MPFAHKFLTCIFEASGNCVGREGLLSVALAGQGMEVMNLTMFDVVVPSTNM
jgi:hypothetical protein